MELIAGDELDTFLEKQLTLSLWSKIYILLNILQGLRHLVSQKIVHLDLKPSNIIVGRSYITKIIDFGEAYHQKVCSSGNKHLIKITCLALPFLTLLPKYMVGFGRSKSALKTSFSSVKNKMPLLSALFCHR